MPAHSPGQPTAVAVDARVGTGRTAEVYAVGERRVLKLFRPPFARDVVLREMRTSQEIARAGLPCPAVFASGSGDGLVEIDGRYGIVFERIFGHSMLHEIVSRPWRIIRHTRQFAHLHGQLHATRATGLPRQRQRLEHLIAQGVKSLPAALAERILAALRSEPDGSAVCHGDLHPDNVLLTADGPKIIDWEPAGQGSPAADVAWTVLLLRHGGVPPGTPWSVRTALFFLRRVFLIIYLREVHRTGLVTQADLRRWIPITAAARLGDGIPEERDALLRLIVRGFPARGRTKRNA